MAYRDLREFIAELEARGWLHRVRAEVDPELEITEITDRVVKAGGPALFFERVRGYDVPVVTNLFGTRERMQLALGTQDFDRLGRELVDLLLPSELPARLVDKLRYLPRLARLSDFVPRVVRWGPCKEVVLRERPSLASFPVLKCWPLDGGRFITLPLVFTRDPATGRRNVGMYRMQVFDERTTGMHWHPHKDGAEHLRRAAERGQRLEVAVALGADPATIYAATAPLPSGVDELLLAGYLRRGPVELVRCETVDLEVPAHAEIVLEGYVDPGETRLEGPFGDHTGYYSPADHYPVFHITCITHRRNPIYPATIVGRPPMEDVWFGKVTERFFLPLLQLQLPEIVDLHFPVEGVFHNCVIVSIRKSYPGQARKVMHALWGTGQLMFTKVIVVVDHDVPVHDPREVWWRVLANLDPRRDVVVVDGPVDVLDHAAGARGYGSKMGLDATKKWPAEGYEGSWPEEIVMDPAVKALVDGKWESYGL
ncbi:MAG: menaquinone biosynthesis decarboxylase [Firmicutes bacterium]|nr:menaquinone biosynthesis decarboxylase [Bacillota bacterium]